MNPESGGIFLGCLFSIFRLCIFHMLMAFFSVRIMICDLPINISAFILFYFFHFLIRILVCKSFFFCIKPI